MLNGLRVIESVYAEADGEPVTVRRLWRERLFSRPWRPWVATYTYTPKVPAMFQMGHQLIVHPALMPELRKSFPAVDPHAVSNTGKLATREVKFSSSGYFGGQTS